MKNITELINLYIEVNTSIIAEEKRTSKVFDKFT